MYEGDLITVTVTYTNNTDSSLTVFPVDSNLSGVLTIGAPNCRWHNLAAHTTKQCATATHTVTADDVAAGTFPPMTTWAATRDRNGTDVIAGGITANADPVTVAQGERPRPRTRWRPRRTMRSATRSASLPPASPVSPATVSPP